MDDNAILEMAKRTFLESALVKDTRMADTLAAKVVPGDFGDHEPITDDMVSVIAIEDREVEISDPILAEKSISSYPVDLNTSYYINVGNLPPNEAQEFVDSIINGMKSNGGDHI